MERTTSRPPPGGGADWAMFFAPLAVTAVVILGALTFVWSSDPEPVDRPEVERVDLSELAPVPESTRLSAVPTTRQLGGGSEDVSVRPAALRATTNARVLDEAPVVEADDDYDDEDEDEDERESEELPDERTPEEIAAAKARTKEHYLGGRTLMSRGLHLSLASAPDSPVDETAADLEATGSSEDEPAIPTESPSQLGGAAGQN